jgi:hypothetical protein
MSMPPDSARPQPVRNWTLACLLLGLASYAVGKFGWAASLEWHAGTWMQRPWVLWTASLAHPTGIHLLASLAALVVLATLGAYLHAGNAAVLALLASWPLCTLALLIWPDVRVYGGMAGLLCAMVGVLWTHAARQHTSRAVAWVLLLSMGGKLLADRAWSQPIGYDPNWGDNVVYAAQLAGFVCGALCGWTATGRGAHRAQASMG